MPSSWSQQIEQAYAVQLTAELKAWFDDEMWQGASRLRFNEFVAPAEMLDTSTAESWAGQLLPDALPLTKDQTGDYICARFAADGKVEEYVLCEHEEGRWVPWAKSFAEALLFDVASTIDAEHSAEQTLSDLSKEHEHVTAWALSWVASEKEQGQRIRALLCDASWDKAMRLMDSGLMHPTMSLLRAQKALTPRLLEGCFTLGADRIARHVGVDLSEIRNWIQDPLLIPDKYRPPLAELLGCSFDELMRVDWDRAAELAIEVVSSRSDLAWPFAVLGRHAERRGDLDTAARHFSSEMRAMATTQAFTRIWYHPPYPFKRRFEQLERFIPESTDKEFVFSKANRRAREHWLDVAHQAESRQDAINAYRAWYRAGWDDYSFGDMPEVLEGLIRAAQAAAFPALEKIAEHHLACL